MRRARTYAFGAAAVVVVGALVVLMLELGSSSAASAVAAAPPAPPPTPVRRAASAPAVPTLAAAEPEAPEAAPVEKLDPQSDAFFYKFDEVVPAALTREAASCYDDAPRVHRNQKLKLTFKTRIRDGVVSVHDVKVDTSTLDNASLEACFIRKVSEATWHDDELPDWDQDDMLVLRPGRGMKKFSRANLAYEGKGPTGPAVMRPGQPKPWSDSATAESAAMADEMMAAGPDAE
jgi:hypothetical protein